MDLNRAKKNGRNKLERQKKGMRNFLSIFIWELLFVYAVVVVVIAAGAVHFLVQ